MSDHTRKQAPVADNLFEHIMEIVEHAKKRRADAMPTEEIALAAMVDAYHRLIELGWKEAVYSPKDGTVFLAIEPGYPGVLTCHYMGDWPTGGWWTHGDGDLWPSRPCLYKPMPQEVKVAIRGRSDE